MIKIIKEELNLDNYDLRKKIRDIYNIYEELDSSLDRFNVDNCSDLDKERIKEFVKKTDEFLKQAQHAVTAMKRSK